MLNEACFLSYDIGPVCPEISVYTNILLVEAFETFTNLGMHSFNSLLRNVRACVRACV